MKFVRTFVGTLFVVLALAVPLLGQADDSTLSQSEIEQIRELRTSPADCVLAFVKFLDLRTEEIRGLYAKPRQPGREQDTHDLLEQFTAIADELSDNLDDYGSRHGDLRRALPKIIDATERWSSTLKSPPDDETYNVRVSWRSNRFAICASRLRSWQATRRRGSSCIRRRRM
jgi:hypothetical protein